MNNDCLFCKIIQREIPANIIYEDEYTLAFLDIAPIEEGHLLIIPKAHSVHLLDTPTEQLQHLMQATHKIAPALKKATQAEGLSLLQSTGKAAGQVIDHIHFHLVPRYQDRPINFKNGSYSTPMRAQELTTAIRQALK